MTITTRYEACKVKPTILAGDWCVRLVHPGGMSAQIMCYCLGESVAKEIATALNVTDAIDRITKESPR